MQTIIACNICGRACCAPELHSEEERNDDGPDCWFTDSIREKREITVIYGKDLV